MTTIARADPPDDSSLPQIARIAKARWGDPEKWMISRTADLTITSAYIESHPLFGTFAGKQIIGCFTLHARSHKALLDHL